MFHSRLLRSICALLITVVVLAGIVQPAVTAAWTVAKFQDFPNTPNLYPTVVTSPSGDFYLAYKRSDVNPAVEELLIQKWNGSSWVTLHRLTPATPAINISGFSDYLSLVVRSDNDIHLVFRGDLGSGMTSLRGVHYGHYNGLAWSFDTVEAFTDPYGWKDANYAALAVDANGNPHVTYVTSDVNGARNCTLVYAVKTTQWNKTTLLNYSGDAEYIRDPNIAVSPTGTANIVYSDSKSLPRRMYLSTNATGTWARTELAAETSGLYLMPTELRADAAGKLYLTYLNGLSYYGTNASGSWVFMPVPGHTTNDGAAGITLNNSGVKILTYTAYDPDWNGHLKVLTQVGSGPWQMETADSSYDFDSVMTAAINDSNKILIVEERQDYVNYAWKQFWVVTASLPLTSVTSVDVPANETYAPGQNLDFTVHFNENVTVNTGGGTPSLSVTLDSGTVQAVYIAGSGSNTLTFRYVVANGNQDPNGIVIGSALTLNSGTIKNGGGSDASLTLAGVASTVGVLVDGLAPAAPVVNVPANGSISMNNTPTIGGTAEAASTVTVYLDGQPVGATTTDAQGGWTWTVGQSLADASYTVKATAADAVGNTSGFSNTNTFTIDRQPPAAPVITAPAEGSATNQKRPTFAGTAEANSTVTVRLGGSPLGTTTADAAGAWSFTQPVDLVDGAYVLQAGAADAAGNTGPLSAPANFTVDTLAPSASLSTTAAEPTHTSPIPLTVTFSEPVSGFSLSGISVVNGTASTLAGSGTSYSLNVTPSGQGPVQMQIQANAGQDAAGNPNTASASLSRTFDSLQPVLLSIRRADANPTSAVTVQYTVSFSKPVSGVDLADFSVSTSGLTGAAIQTVTGSGSTYSVSAVTGSGTGTLRLDLADDGSILDSAGNLLNSSGAGWTNGAFSGGETYQIDRTAPQVQLTTHSKLPRSGSDSYSFTVRYTDVQGIDAAGLGDGDLHIVGSDLDRAAVLVSIVDVTPGTVVDVTYQIATPTAGWESLTVKTYDVVLEANQVRDLAGNFAPPAILGSLEREQYHYYYPQIGH